jgi:hypothetical protein
LDEAWRDPPVGLILCAEKGAAEAHHALDNLSSKVLAAEYQTILPDEKLIAEELERSAKHWRNSAYLTTRPEAIRIDLLLSFRHLADVLS